jgi:FtsP/CotA-like multicopper oxidase with cupredoxin domain
MIRVGLAALLALAAGLPARAEPRAFDLAIRDGQLPEAQRLLRVRQGDEVTFRWTADRTVTVHLHGYDVEARVTSEAPVAMRITARATGRFPIELHHAGGRHVVIGYLEVHPR